VKAALLCEGMAIRARLTNGFSKKLENHAAAVALHQMFYNFVRTDQTLTMTPAMAAGVTPKLWEMSDVIAIIDAWKQIAVRRALGIKSRKSALGTASWSVSWCAMLSVRLCFASYCRGGAGLD
jgi:hypothetical protein